MNKRDVTKALHFSPESHSTLANSCSLLSINPNILLQNSLRVRLPPISPSTSIATVKRHIRHCSYLSRFPSPLFYRSPLCCCTLVSMMMTTPTSYGGGFPPHEQTQTFTSAESSATLLVRHLPEAIPQDTLVRLFSHYGASSVRPCAAAGKLRNCAFVDFQTEALASQALLQLNRLRFLGKVITVERASSPSQNDKKNQQGEAPPLNGKDSSSLPTSLFKVTSSTANPTKGANSVGEPIAPTLGIDYPFPPHLEYAYPPPDGNILTNIVNALIAVPRFYTQVLHLMNKMNIPAPFRAALPTPPLPSPVPPPPPPLPPAIVAKPPMADLSSDESELESSEEGDDDEGKTNFVKAPRGVKHDRKRPRREAIVGPAVDKDVAHEAVGLKPASLVPKEIPMIKKKNPVMQIKLAAKPLQNETKTDADSMNESGQVSKDDLELKPYATTEDIMNGKLPPEEILSLPMFKNYAAGNPATVLYIKNLAKDVVNDDFYFIFGSLFGTTEVAKSSLSIKLMQEGRMRGQAFVTFPSVELAHHALNLANGYVFKGKPMIIQFGRNPAAGRAN